jgi:hypothetical protein
MLVCCQGIPDLSNYEHVVSFAIHTRGIQKVHVRDTLRKVGSHDIQMSPVLTSDRFFTGHVMGIFSRVTPLGIIP